jgi:alpha-N-arabinofuranosidase
MAASAQAINVLQALISSKGAQLVLTPTYHVFEMYKAHRDGVSLPVELSAPRYALGKGSLPTLQASASRDARGVVHLSLVNLEPNRGAELRLKVSGAPAQKVSGRTLTAPAMTAPAMTALNDFGATPNVLPVPFRGIQVKGDPITLSLPSKSATVLDIE